MSLVGMAIIGAVGLSGAWFYSQNGIQREDLSRASLCRDIAENVQRQIRSNGTQSRIFRTPADGANLSLNDPDWHQNKNRFNVGNAGLNPGGVTSEVGTLTDSRTRWPNVQLLNGFPDAIPPYSSNAPLLIQGSINSLLDILNTWPSICNASPDYRGLQLQSSGPLRALVPKEKMDNDKYTVSASMKIQPYNRYTGSLVSCPSPGTPYLLRPPAKFDPPSAVHMAMISFDQPGYNRHYKVDEGLEVEVFVTLKAKPMNRDTASEVTEQEIKCSAKSQYQYDAYKRQPPAPGLAVVNAAGTATYTITANPADFDPGTQMICQEWHRFVPTDMDGLVAMARNPGAAAYQKVVSQWRPCKSIPFCERAPISATEDIQAGTVTMTYPTDPSCEAGLTVRVFDIAGNLSDDRIQTVYGGTVYPTSEPGRPIESEASGSSETPGGYRVGNLEFLTHEAAARAAELMGKRIEIVGIVIDPQDARIERLAQNIQATVVGLDATQAQANAAIANGQAVAGANQPGTTGTSGETGAQIGNVGNAIGGVDSAIGAANGNLNAANAVLSGLGPLGQSPAVEIARAQAQALVDKTVQEIAKLEVEKAKLEALKAELERQKAEQERKEQEERERREREEDDDDTT